MRGVIYARYSSDNQRKESIEGQIRGNTAYAQKNGIDIVGTYIDRAYSAKTDNRPKFQRMIKDSAKKLRCCYRMEARPILSQPLRFGKV